MSKIIFKGEGLLHQSYGGTANPGLLPGLIRPADAERKIRFAGGQDFIEWPFQYSSAGKPIMVVAESVDSELLRELCLGFARFRQAQIVEPKIGRQMRLVVAPKARPRLDHVCPFREALTPPGVVVWSRVELGKIESNESWTFRA